MIELKDLSFGWKKKMIFKRLSLSIKSQSRTALVGSSGAGKSTLLKLVAGLSLPNEGEVWIDGRLVSSGGTELIAPFQRNISMLFQDLGLWPNLSVFDNVFFATQNLVGIDRKKATQEILSLCRIEEVASSLPNEISGGQQQRAAIARALVCRPKYLFLDEPFSALDLETKFHLFEELKRLIPSETSILLVTHDPLEACQLCQDIIGLENGQVIDSGAISEVRRNAKLPLLQMFFEHYR